MTLQSTKNSYTIPFHAHSFIPSFAKSLDMFPENGTTCILLGSINLQISVLFTHRQPLTLFRMGEGKNKKAPPLPVFPL